MNRKLHFSVLTLVATLFLIKSGNNCFAGNNNPTATREQAKQWMKSQPVQFLENKGQMTDMNHQPVPYVLFKAEGKGMNLYITETGLTYVFIKTEQKIRPLVFDPKNGGWPFDRMGMHDNEERKIEWNRIDMQLKGAKISKENIKKEGASKDFKQYFLGHCPDGITDVHSYQKITIKDIYPNIDWVFYNSTEKGFKYDFIVHPGAKAEQIELVYSSLNPLNLDENGNLQIKTALGTLTENAPVSFLGKEKIESSFIKTLIQKSEKEGFETHVKFLIDEVANKNFEVDLVIDPQLVWATAFGGEGIEYITSLSLDNFDNVLITGTTTSLYFPTYDSGNFFQGFYAGGDGDVFITKFDSDYILVWSTYYGGSNFDQGNTIITDSEGNIFITGFVSSADFPTFDSGNFFQEFFAGGGGEFALDSDVFIIKFDNMGNRLWATYYGGQGDEEDRSITLDKSDNLYITGSTASYDFPIQSAGTYFQEAIGDTNNFIDMFILKFDNLGNRLWSTFYGGSGREIGFDVKTDNNGNVFLVGFTTSDNFPSQDIGGFYQNVLSGVSDGFILKFDSIGNRLWSTLYGGGDHDAACSISPDLSGNLFIAGETSSTDFPLQEAGTYFQELYLGDSRDVFILKFDSIGNRLWSTYYGGSGDDYGGESGLVTDKCGNLYFGFSTKSDDIFTKTCIDGGYIDSTFNDNIYNVYHTYLSKFSNSGILKWGTYCSGNGDDFFESITLDRYDNLFLTAQSYFGVDSTYPQVDPGSGAYFDNTFNLDGFIAKFEKIPVRAIASNASCNCTGTASLVSNDFCELDYSYLWSDGQTTQTATNLCPGNYSVIVADTTGIIFIDTVLISQDTLSVQIEIEKDIFCIDEPISFNSSISYVNQEVNFLWSTNPLDTLSSFASILNETGYVSLTVSDQNNCIAKDSVYITIVPQLTINATKDTCICLGESTNLRATGTPTYYWSNGDSTSTITVSPETTTTYIVFYDDGVCNVTIDSTIVCVNPNPSVVASEDTSMAYNASIVLEAVGDGLFYWSPENSLSCAACATPTATPNANTTYIVTAANQFGCTAQDSVLVELYYYDITIPNIITPNGDGMNDYFNIVGLPNNSAITIFNRWGNELYVTRSYQNDWSIAADGVYFYILHTPDGKFYNGSFQIN